MDSKKSNNPTFPVMLGTFQLYSLKICMEKLMEKLLKSVQKETISGESNNPRKSSTIQRPRQLTKTPFK